MYAAFKRGSDVASLHVKEEQASLDKTSEPEDKGSRPVDKTLFQEKMSDSENDDLTWYERLSSSERNKRVDDKLLSDVADYVGEQYEKLAYNLGLKRPEIMNCRANRPGSMEGAVTEMLIKWKAKEGSRATLQKLIKALREAEIDDAYFEEAVQKFLKRN